MIAGSHAEAPAGEPDGEVVGALWLVTFVDLTALLIAFMVMLFAMSELDPVRWQEVRDSLLQHAETPSETAAEVALVRSEESEGLEPVETLPGIDLDYLGGVLHRGLAAEPALGGVAVRRLADRLVVALPGRLLFAPGGTALGREGRAATATLADMLGNVDNRIEVVGHAAPPPPPPGIASNWELSLARALAVASLIEQVGYGRPVAVRGFGDARFGALAASLPEAERRALARRVDVVIHADVGERER